MKGYPNDLYILAFDHRGTLTKGLLGVEGRAPTEGEVSRVSSMNCLLYTSPSPRDRYGSRMPASA